VRELIDCHVHTELSGHGEGTVGAMVGAAVFRGLGGVVFTEHLPLPEGLDRRNHISMPASSLESYVREVEQWAERARGLDIVAGGEADWLPDHEFQAETIRASARDAGVRVVLGSVHFLDGWAFDDPHHIEEWDSRDVDRVWERYFEVWCDACASGAFDVMAHPDLVKKFGHRMSGDPTALYEEAARVASAAGVAIEVSTAGLRKPAGELYPGPDLLAAFRRAGVEATVGSDAHAADEVGFEIATAYEALAAAGYSRVAFPLGDREMRWINL